MIANADEFSRIGMRAGFSTSSTGKFVNYSYGLEVGTFPGGESINRSLYFNLKFGLSLFKRAGHSQVE